MFRKKTYKQALNRVDNIIYCKVKYAFDLDSLSLSLVPLSLSLLLYPLPLSLSSYL